MTKATVLTMATTEVCLFLSAKETSAKGSCGASEARGHEARGTIGTDQAREGSVRGRRRGGGLCRRGGDLGLCRRGSLLRQNLLRGGDEVVDLTPELRRQVLGLPGRLAGEDGVELALDLGQHGPRVGLAGRGQQAGDLHPDLGRHGRVGGQLLRGGQEAGDAPVAGGRRLGSLRADILFLDSSIIRQSSNPVCGSWKNQASSLWAKQHRA